MKLYKAMAIERAEEIFAAYHLDEQIQQFKEDIIDDLTLAFETGYCVARSDSSKKADDWVHDRSIGDLGVAINRLGEEDV